MDQSAIQRPVQPGAAQDEAVVLERLRSIVGGRGLDDLGVRLADLADLVRWDVAEVEKALESLPRTNGAGGAFHVQASAHHLLDLGGKRLRPMCVALAARMGSGFDERARDLAMAVELVHCATLLHDDVVDVGDTRRGAPAARTVYGNAASIFAGDWLLVAALQRVRAAKVPGTLERLLDVIEEMIFAESLQLEQRGRVDATLENYFKVVDGKTAALFRWAMYAGAVAGDLDEASAEALSSYGRHLGMAFQLVDDVLDYAGDPAETGKALFADLREGKMTYPLLLVRERDPRAEAILHAVVRDGDESGTGELLKALEATGALSDCRKLAQEHAQKGIDALAELPRGRAYDALLTVTEATVHRGK